MKWLNALWAKTKKIASLYTATFIFVMFLNQLLFFGLCLNPICLIAAMPHVLLITVVLGTLINKISKSSDVEKPSKKSAEEPSKAVTAENNDSFLDRAVNAAISFEKATRALDQKAEAYRIKSIETNKKELAELRALAKVSFPKHKPQDKAKTVGTVYNKEGFSLVKERRESFVNNQTTPVNPAIGKEPKKIDPIINVSQISNELSRLNISKNNELLAFEKESKEGGLNVSFTDSIDLKKHYAVQQAKSRHYIKAKFRLRESIVKHNEKVNSEESKLSEELLSTTMVCKANGIKSCPDFFKYLIEYELLFFKDKKYYLTDKGKLFGGRYRTNGKGDRWVVWPYDALHTLIYSFKQPLLDRLEINYLMHITHITNLSGILSKGLLPHNNKVQKVDISNGLVNARRAKKEPINKHSIHDYVPFYFNVRNAMLFQVQKEFGENVIVLSFRKEVIASPKVIFSRGNASSLSAIFTSDINELAAFNWQKIFSSSWIQNGVADLELKSIMMSECLVYNKVDINKLHCIYCQNVDAQQRIIEICEDKKIHINVAVDPMLFF